MDALCSMIGQLWLTGIKFLSIRESALFSLGINITPERENSTAKNEVEEQCIYVTITLAKVTTIKSIP